MEVVAVGTPTEEFDCLLFELNEVRVRPLDGLCGADSGNEGDPCLNDADCTAGSGSGICEGSNAGEIIGNDGIVAVLSTDTTTGDLWSGPCAPTNDLVNEFFPGYTRDTWAAPPIYVLSDGLYEITTSGINNVAIYRDDADVNNVDLRQCASSSDISMPTELGPGVLRFTMSGVDRVIRYEVDIAALEQMFQPFDAANCTTLRNNMADIIECTTCDAGVAP